MIRRRLYEKRKGNDMQNLMAELEALKAAAAAQAAAEAPVEEAPAEETPVEDTTVE
jgi:ribosomal protein L12E/L44/L45/RPP1/RPP2